jgi:hypothetical protein
MNWNARAAPRREPPHTDHPAKGLDAHRVAGDPGSDRLVPTGQAVAEWLALSDERDQFLARILDAERRGFGRGVASMADEYQCGFADGIFAYKAAQHDLYRLVGGEMARWGGWREDFGRPRPGDFPGRGGAA